MSTPIAGINQQIFFLLPIAFFFKKSKSFHPQNSKWAQFKSYKP